MFHLLGAIDFKTSVYFLYPELMASLPQRHSAGAEVRVTVDGIWRLRKPRRALRGCRRAVLALPESTGRSSGPFWRGPQAVGWCLLALPSSRHAPAPAPLPAFLGGLAWSAPYTGVGAHTQTSAAQAFPPGE